MVHAASTRSLLAFVLLCSCGGSATPPAAAPESGQGPPATAPGAPAHARSEPFAMRIVAERLRAAVATLQDCKQGDMVGDGHVRVVFAPHGGVQSAIVHGAPFEGTPTGECVARHMQALQVPPFTGAPFAVDKAFSIR
jgi:hypothetical protein